MIGFLAAAAMAASFFMPWVDLFGSSLAPSYFFDENAPPFRDYPWRILAIFASFPIAALAALLVVAQRRAGWAMLLAGGIPLWILLEPVVRGMNEIKDMPFDIPTGGNTDGALDAIGQFITYGVPVYLTSAVVLVVVGLIRMVRGR